MAQELVVDRSAWVIVRDLARAIEPSPAGLNIAPADAVGEIGLESLVPRRGEAVDRTALCGIPDAILKGGREARGRLRFFAIQIVWPVEEWVGLTVRAADGEDKRCHDDHVPPANDEFHGKPLFRRLQ